MHHPPIPQLCEMIQQESLLSTVSFKLQFHKPIGGPSSREYPFCLIAFTKSHTLRSMLSFSLPYVLSPHTQYSTYVITHPIPHIHTTSTFSLMLLAFCTLLLGLTPPFLFFSFPSSPSSSLSLFLLVLVLLRTEMRSENRKAFAASAAIIGAGLLGCAGVVGRYQQQTALEQFVLVPVNGPMLFSSPGGTATCVMPNAPASADADASAGYLCPCAHRMWVMQPPSVDTSASCKARPSREGHHLYTISNPFTHRYA